MCVESRSAGALCSKEAPAATYLTFPISTRRQQGECGYLFSTFWAALLCFLAARAAGLIEIVSTGAAGGGVSRPLKANSYAQHDSNTFLLKDLLSARAAERARG